MKLSAIATKTGPKFYMGGTEVLTLAEAVQRATDAGFVLQVRLVKPKPRDGLWKDAPRLKKLFKQPPK
jgi:hypothetical protein